MMRSHSRDTYSVAVLCGFALQSVVLLLQRLERFVGSSTEGSTRLQLTVKCHVSLLQLSDVIGGKLQLLLGLLSNERQRE